MPLGSHPAVPSLNRGVLVVIIGLLLCDGAVPRASDSRPVTPRHDNAVLQWNSALLQAVRNTRFAPLFTARALAIAHTCMYDAWAAYDARAVGTVLGESLRRPRWERTDEAKRVAVSFAAYRALRDLFPSQQALFDDTMRQMGLDPLDASTDGPTPA